MSPALIAGFADPASGLAGIGWRRGAGSGGLLALAGRDPAPAAAAFEEDADRVVLRLEADGATAEAELAQDVTAPEDGRSEPAVRMSRCAAAVRSAEGEPTECLGHATRWADDPLAGLGSLRHLAVPHGSALAIVIAERPEGAEHQGGDRVEAWLLGDGSAERFDEALLSTHYDAEGIPFRAGLELWPQEPDAPPLRATATRLGAAAHGPGWAGLMESSTEGTLGLASYVLWTG